MLSRPSLDEIRAWRAAVDAALLAAIDDLPAELIALGLNHEQQHQELMLMDLTADLRRESARTRRSGTARPRAPAAWRRRMRWLEGREGHRRDRP